MALTLQAIIEEYRPLQPTGPTGIGMLVLDRFTRSLGHHNQGSANKLGVYASTSRVHCSVFMVDHETQDLFSLDIGMGLGQTCTIFKKVLFFSLIVG